MFISVLVFAILGLVIAPRAEFIIFMGLAIIAGSTVLFLDKETVIGGVAVVALGAVVLSMYFLV
jgi:hypothetical protein